MYISHKETPPLGTLLDQQNKLLSVSEIPQWYILQNKIDKCEQFLSLIVSFLMDLVENLQKTCGNTWNKYVSVFADLKNKFKFSWCAWLTNHYRKMPSCKYHKENLFSERYNNLCWILYPTGGRFHKQLIQKVKPGSFRKKTKYFLCPLFTPHTLTLTSFDSSSISDV